MLFYGIFGMYRILFVVVFHIVMCAFALLIANCVCVLVAAKTAEIASSRVVRHALGSQLDMFPFLLVFDFYLI